MKIDSGQLHAFLTVVREGSFEAAARVLNVTPSAVSQRIRQLEDRIGQALVKRSIPCRPTAAGKSLSRYAEQLSLLEAETLRDLSSAAFFDPNQLRIPIAINADSLEGWFMAAFEEIPVDCSLYFDLRVDDQDYSAGMLRDGSVLAAVTSDSSPVQGCVVVPLGSMPYLAVASREFARRFFSEGVNTRTLAVAPMITFNAKDSLQQRFMQRFGDQTPAPPTHFIPSSNGFVEGSRRGIGWCMAPELLVRQHLMSGELVNIAPGPTLDVPLYLQHWRMKSQILSVFTQAVRTVAQRLLKQNTDIALPQIASHSIAGLKSSRSAHVREPSAESEKFL